MFQVGPLELLVVGIIALLVLGPARLPEAARSVGKGMRELREAMSGEGDDEDDDEDDHRNEPDAKHDDQEEEDQPVPSPS